MAQAIVTSQLMNLHYGRLKDQGRLSPVQVLPSLMTYTRMVHGVLLPNVEHAYLHADVYVDPSAKPLNHHATGCLPALE